MFSFFRKKIKTIEDWAISINSMAEDQHLLPDDIIAAAVVQSIAKDFDKWKTIGGNFLEATGSGYNVPPKLFNEEKKITIQRKVMRKQVGDPFDHVYKYKFNGMTVNDVPVSARAEKLIASSYRDIKLQLEATKQVAAEAEKKMKTNEAAWNIAERLLGMKRVNGALVPVNTMEG